MNVVKMVDVILFAIIDLMKAEPLILDHGTVKQVALIMKICIVSNIKKIL